MRAFHFTDRDLAGIRYDRFYHPHPRVQLKMEVLWLKAQGLQGLRTLFLSKNSVKRLGLFPLRLTRWASPRCCPTLFLIATWIRSTHGQPPTSRAHAPFPGSP